MEAFSRFRFGRFEFDPHTFKLLRDGTAVPIEPKALDVLHVLLTRAPRVVDKGEIFSLVWKDVAVTDNALTRVIAQLRKALDDDPRAPRYIETIATRGYRFAETVTVVEIRPAWHTDAASEPARRAPVSRVRFAAAAAALVAIGAVAGLYLARTAPPNPLHSGGVPAAALAALRPQQLTAGRGFDGFLAFAPDGMSIAYSSDRSGALEIYVQGVAPGATAMALTNNGRQNVQPAWSPDGQFIAYHEMSGNGIWIVPSRGGVARRVSDFGANPVWSPDGTAVAFQSLPINDLNPLRTPGALSTIWIVDALGRGEPSALTTRGEPAGPHLAPAWWPDSTRVIFSVSSGSKTGRGGALWSVDVASRQLREIAAHERLTPDYTLTPDGLGVYFIARNTNAIWWLSLSTEGTSTADPQPTGLPGTGSMLTELTISPDGRRLGWTTIDSSSHIWATLAERRSSPSGAAPLTDGAGVHYGFPAPASDGRVALVGRRHGTDASLFLLSQPGSLRQLTTDSASHSGAQWTADGREVVVVADHGEGAAFWAIDPETGRERSLFALAELPRPPGRSQPSTASPAANVAFAPDFTRLAMAIVRDGVPNLWVAGLRQIEGGERDRGSPGLLTGRGGTWLTPPDGTLTQQTFERDGGSYPTWSADGRWIAYQCAEGTDTHVCVTDARGGDRLQLTDEPGQSWIGGWAPDNDTVVFAARRGGIWNIATVSRSTATERTVTRFADPRSYVRYPRWDAFRQRVVFERAETSGRLWAVKIRDDSAPQPLVRSRAKISDP